MFRKIIEIVSRKKTQTTNDAAQGDVLLKELSEQSESEDNGAVVALRTSQSEEGLVRKKKDNAEIFNDAVNRLVEKLEGINDNLGRQLHQNEQLVRKIEILPDLLSTLPNAVEEQKQVFSDIADQMRLKMVREEKTAQHLAGIHDRISESTKTGTEMSQNLDKVATTIGKLDEDTANQTEWIRQMNQTFMASEQYVKETIGKQQTRFYWVFGISLAATLLAIGALVFAILFFLNQSRIVSV